MRFHVFLVDVALLLGALHLHEAGLHVLVLRLEGLALALELYFRSLQLLDS